MAMEYLEKLDNIKSIIKLYKHEQEKLILKSHTDESKLKSKLKTSAADKLEQGTSQDASVTKILNIDCVVMPTSRTTASYHKLWPQALLVNRSKNCAEIGLIESHGSLWKLVPCRDSYPGSRVMLQTSEIGEVPRYLGNDLDIVDLKVDAAVWKIRVSSLPYDESVVEVEGGVELPRGVVVQLELLDDIDPKEPDNSTAIPSAISQQHQQDQLLVEEEPPLLLVCETSMELRNYSELAVEQLPTPALSLLDTAGSSDKKSSNFSDGIATALVESDTLHTTTPDGHPVYRTYQWEIIPDSWITCELDFLEGFIQ